MPWGDQWPAVRGDALSAEHVFNELRAALLERDGLVPAGQVPPAFARFSPIRGTPKGGQPPHRTVANFQHEVQEMLALVWPLRWWDPTREALYTLQTLCQDAFGRDGWTCDLTTDPPPAWPPAAATVFDELYQAVNRLDRLRILPTVSESARHDSVYRLTAGITDWPEDRADTFSLFDGADDGVQTGLEYDVGMGGEVYDDGFSQQWILESRRFAMAFATGALSGFTIAGARLDFATAAPGGEADYSDTFTAEVVDHRGEAVESFASDDFGPKRIALPPEAINTAGDSLFTIRSARLDTDDRPAWDVPGPNYTSTYREGLAVVGPVRLIVEVAFEYHG